MTEKQYIKINIKINTLINNWIKTNFHGNKIPKDNECCSYLSVILLDFVVNVTSTFRMVQICNERVKDNNCNQWRVRLKSNGDKSNKFDDKSNDDKD